MKYPRGLTILALLTVVGLAFSLYMELPTLSKAAQDGFGFGVRLDALIVLLTISVMGLRVWKHQAAVEEAVMREKNDVRQMADSKRYVLLIIFLSVYAAVPILCAILFSVGT